MTTKNAGPDDEVDDDEDTLVDADNRDTERVVDPDAVRCKESGDRLKNGKCPNTACPLYDQPQGG